MDIISPQNNYFKVQTFLNLVFMNNSQKSLEFHCLSETKNIFSQAFHTFSSTEKELKKAVFQLTWSLPPHLPLPEFFRGLTPRIRHARRRLCVRFTWILLTVSAMDFQPQTRKTARFILSAAPMQFKDHSVSVFGTIKRSAPGTASI
jgi:hypothetical protein